MVTGRIRAAIFDVDGVLLNSLPEHLAICRDEAEKFGLRIEVPSVEQFREMVRSGVKVSPMIEFFRAVGFPDDLAEDATDDYQRLFDKRYRPKPFPGTAAMLEKLKDVGLRLGLVTSNTSANVLDALGKSVSRFDEPARFFFDSVPRPMSKADALAACVRNLGVHPSECVYVGDQPADVSAAASAGVRFLGVGYGWGLDATSGATVGDVREIPAAIERLDADTWFEPHSLTEGYPR